MGGSRGPIASETLDDVILDELEDYGVDWDVPSPMTNDTNNRNSDFKVTLSDCNFSLIKNLLERVSNSTIIAADTVLQSHVPDYLHTCTLTHYKHLQCKIVHYF